MTKDKETSATKKQEQKQEAPTEKATAVEEVAAVVEPTNMEVVSITQGLPPEIAERVQGLLDLANTKKMGFDESQDDRWQPPMVKMRQAMTSDYPSSVDQGGLFTTAGDALEQPWEFIPLYMVRSNVRFDVLDDSGEKVPGFCRSEDRKHGFNGMPCADCPDLPWRDNKKTLCSKGIDVYCFDKDFTDLYRISFINTSSTNGEKFYRKNNKASTTTKPLWSRVQALTTFSKERKKGGGSYYIFEAQPTGEIVDQKFYPLCQALFLKIEQERAKLLAENAERAKERGAVGQKVLDNLPSDFGGDSPVIDVQKGGQPKFDDM